MAVPCVAGPGVAIPRIAGPRIAGPAAAVPYASGPAVPRRFQPGHSRRVEDMAEDVLLTLKRDPVPHEMRGASRSLQRAAARGRSEGLGGDRDRCREYGVEPDSHLSLLRTESRRGPEAIRLGREQRLGLVRGHRGAFLKHE